MSTSLLPIHTPQRKRVMEFEEDFTMPPPPSYADSVPNPSRVKMPTQPPPTPAMPRNSGKGRYMECLKNHALPLGGHALDGCCEFMAAGADGTLDALKCAACNCHRNFHRKETVAGDPYLLPHHHYNPFHNHRHHQAFPQFAACYRAQGAGYLHVSGHQRGGGSTPTLALPSISGGGGGTTQSTRDDHEDGSEPSGGGGGVGSSSKKRFRTKFSPEQKEKMAVFAESVGWKLQKHDEVAVQEFCDEVGVKRHVLKVWMHNHKNTLAIKKP